MLTCYVVDDEPHAVETLESYIQKAPELELIGSSDDPLDALEQIGKNIHPDITFLDVDMPQLSGIDLAGLISDHTTVVITTAFPDYALEAFEKNAFGYLLKPISFDRFLGLVKKLLAVVQPAPRKSTDDHIYVKSNTKGAVVRVNFRDIWYVVSIKNYLHIHTHDEQLITYLTMHEMENALPAGQFFRIHRSFIVNAAMIKTVSGSHVQLQKDIKIPIGQLYRSALQQYINEKLLQSAR